jgi:predicted DNA-binding transcriptional regulator AlpA
MSLEQIRALEARIERLEQSSELPLLMTPKQVCEYVGISERQFYTWKGAGDVPTPLYLSARTVRYDRDDVVAWAKSHKVGGAG